MAKTLIAFFSRADENYFGGAMRYVKVGNTEIVVGLMKELIDADTFKIEMKDPMKQRKTNRIMQDRSLKTILKT